MIDGLVPTLSYLKGGGGGGGGGGVGGVESGLLLWKKGFRARKYRGRPGKVTTF